jgi:NADH-quinone oxidoreductase subunit M
MFVITTLSVIGLPMLNGFVGEFLVFSGSMQSKILHHTGWTVLATSGVILTAAYMLTMIQKVFYGDLGLKSRAIPGRDLDAREHLALWPMVALFLLMGVVSPYWMRAIDQTGERLSAEPTAQSTLEQESMPISTAAPKTLREQARPSLSASVMTSSPSQGGPR